LNRKDAKYAKKTEKIDGNRIFLVISKKSFFFAVPLRPLRLCGENSF